MISSSKTAMFVGAVLLLAGAVQAGANAAAETLESKQRLVELQLTQSPAALRIRQSSHTLAKKKLSDAQGYFARAQAESRAGRVPAASQLLDESLRQIVAASRLVPDVAHQAALERNQNVELREALRTFQSLHKNLTNRMGNTKVQTSTVTVDIGQIDAMAVKADALIAGGNQHEANVLLNTAYKGVVSTLNNMLAAQTIVYDLKFDSPTEEFRHELARNRSYEELVPIALAQLNTSGEAATLAERHVQQSRNLRDAAGKQAGVANYPVALKTIQDATDHLQRALRIAGVLVPQPSEFKP